MTSRQEEWTGESALNDSQAMAVIEALIFASGEPLAEDLLCQIVDLSLSRLRDVIALLQAKYEVEESGLSLRKIGDCYCLVTKAELKEYMARLFRPQNRQALTKAAYETLACIAYNQPCTRAQVEDVRGVNSDSIISRLQDRGLIEEIGQLELPGRPGIFQVTAKFLREFGLESVADLAPMEMLDYSGLSELAAKQED